MGEVTIQILLDDLNTRTQEVLDNLHDMNEEQLELFVSERQRIVEQLELYRTDLSEVDKQQIGSILSNDSEIVQRMYVLQDKAGEWLEKRGSIREQKNAYQHAYAIDSMFIDHRK